LSDTWFATAEFPGVFRIGQPFLARSFQPAKPVKNPKASKLEAGLSWPLPSGRTETSVHQETLMYGKKPKSVEKSRSKIDSGGFLI